jgi:hypothetical protein
MANIYAIMNEPSLLGGNPDRAFARKKEEMKTNYRKYIEKYKHLAFLVYVKEEANKVSSVLYHFWVKSLKNEEVAYDIVIELFPNKNSVDNTMKSWDAKLFSNSPGFVYKYAYLYNKHNVLPEMLQYKFSNVTLETPPSKTNPQLAMGFDNPTFTALHYLADNPNLLSLDTIPKDFVRPIREFEPSEIPTPEEIEERRSPKSLIDIKKLTMKVSKIVKKPLHYFGAGKKAEKAKGAKSGVKAKTAQSAHKPRKAIKAISSKRKKG